MSFIEQTGAMVIDDVKISYVHIGKGEPVLFLHGNPGTKRDFTEVYEYAAKSGLHCCSIDRPGHMNSEELLGLENNKWLDAETYINFIKKYFNKKITLVGYSLGAFLALKTALNNSDFIKNIVLVAPFVMPNNENEKQSSIPALARNPLLGTLLGILMPYLAYDKMKNHFDNVYFPQEVPEEYMEKFLPRFTRFESLLATITDKNTMLSTLKEVHEKLGDINCSVTVISGEKDKVCSQERQLEVLKGIKNIEIIKIEDGGHALPFTNAEKVASIIKKVAVA